MDLLSESDEPHDGSRKRTLDKVEIGNSEEVVKERRISNEVLTTEAQKEPVLNAFPKRNKSESSFSSSSKNIPEAQTRKRQTSAEDIVTKLRWLVKIALDPLYARREIDREIYTMCSRKVIAKVMARHRSEKNADFLATEAQKIIAFAQDSAKRMKKASNSVTKTKLLDPISEMT